MTQVLCICAIPGYHLANDIQEFLFRVSSVAQSFISAEESNCFLPGALSKIEITDIQPMKYILIFCCNVFWFLAISCHLLLKIVVIVIG